MMRLAVLACVIACGGGHKPVAPAVGSGSGSARPERCCCEWIQESGDPDSDTWSENQTHTTVTKATCDGNTGTCVDAAKCQ